MTVKRNFTIWVQLFTSDNVISSGIRAVQKIIKLIKENTMTHSRRDK